MVPPFPRARADLEQVETPVAPAIEMLQLAAALGDITDRTVLDLGSGTGRLAIGAACLGARQVVGIEIDERAVELARDAAKRLGAREVRFRHGAVSSARQRADTVVMNPPFGAQRRGADRPFWDVAFRLARRRIYAFALSESRTFILGRAVEAGAYVEATRPVPWDLPRTFPHHRRDRVALAVDLWAIRTEELR